MAIDAAAATPRPRGTCRVVIGIRADGREADLSRKIAPGATLDLGDVPLAAPAP